MKELLCLFLFLHLCYIQRARVNEEVDKSLGRERSIRSTAASSTTNMDEARLLLPQPRAGDATSIDAATAAAAYGGWGMPVLNAWSDEIVGSGSSVPKYGTQGMFLKKILMFFNQLLLTNDETGSETRTSFFLVSELHS
jgi:hypothetical protein